MADVPQNLLQQIKDFEEQFTVDRSKLKQIVNHFVKELEKGASLPTLPAFNAARNASLRLTYSLLYNRSQCRGRKHRK